MQKIDSLIPNPMDALMEQARTEEALAWEEERQFEAALAASLSDNNSTVSCLLPDNESLFQMTCL